MDEQWYAVHTKPRSELQAVRWIRHRTSVEVFFPKLEVLRRRRQRVVRSIEALFPSYVFARMTLGPDQWHAVKWAPGVRGIVGIGDTPVAVPDQAIALLKERCQVDVIRWQPRLVQGTRVRLTTGPFAGFIGVLERPTAGAERVRVLLNLMRAPTPVVVDVVDLEECSAVQ